MKQLEAERDRLRTAATLALQYVEIQHDGQAVTDVVERLRAYAKDQGGWHNIDDTCEQAADEIVQLRAERDRLRDVLVLAETYSDCMGVITVEAIRAALGDTK
jgi:alkanesulfonate monooxygenase SsuD/methylene tetrahydromethanopterin reductase-like flavin-dependent oxidoreductase (luciferase family)